MAEETYAEVRNRVKHEVDTYSSLITPHPEATLENSIPIAMLSGIKFGIEFSEFLAKNTEGLNSKDVYRAAIDIVLEREGGLMSLPE